MSSMVMQTKFSNMKDEHVGFRGYPYGRVYLFTVNVAFDVHMTRYFLI